MTDPPQVFWTGPQRWLHDSRGTMVIGAESDVMLCNAVAGHLSVALASQIRDDGEEIVRQHGRVRIFCDWSRMVSYETESRKLLTDWSVGLGDRLEELHIIGGSMMVRMGLAVASIAVRILVSHSSREDFLDAYRSCPDRG